MYDVGTELLYINVYSVVFTRVAEKMRTFALEVGGSSVVLDTAFHQ